MSTPLRLSDEEMDVLLGCRAHRFRPPRRISASGAVEKTAGERQRGGLEFDFPPLRLKARMFLLGSCRPIPLVPLLMRRYDPRYVGLWH
jgi:hypothetical protein